jgi:hypothetical protein
MSRETILGIVMKTILINIFLFLFLGSLFYGCSVSNSGATVKIYNSPSLNSGKIASIAFFPLRNQFVQTNALLGTGDMLEINRMFQTEFSNKNSKLQLFNSNSSIELLNKFNLVNSYDTLLSVYNNTGIPNTQILDRIGQAIKVDAIIQGFVVDISEKEILLGVQETKVIVKYVMFSTKSGEILWEATCSGYKQLGAYTSVPPPPISDLIEILRAKIIPELPIL